MKRMNVSVVLFMMIFVVSFTSASSFCSNGVQGENELRIISVDDMLQENSKEWVWQVYEDVELEIRVENRDENGNNYVLEIAFFDGNNEVLVASDDDDLIEKFSLSAGERKSVPFKFDINGDLSKGEYALAVKFYEKERDTEFCVENNDESILLEKLEFCGDGNVPLDDLEIEKISDDNGDNPADWDWMPGDDIEVSARVLNNDYSGRDFVARLLLLDEDNREVILSEDVADLSEGFFVEIEDSEKVSFDFSLNSYLEEGDYFLYAIVSAESDSDICTSLKAEERDDPVSITISRPDNSVLVSKVSGPKELYVGDVAEYRVKVINLGDEEEERVKVFAYNYNLGANEFVEIDSLAIGEEREVVLFVDVPEGFSPTETKIAFSTEFEYDSGLDFYRGVSDEDDDIFYVVEVFDGENPENVVEEIVEEAIAPEPVVEEQIVEDEVLVEETEFIENDEQGVESVITGAVVGTSGENGWVWVIIIIVFLIFVVVSYRGVQKKKLERIYAQPKIMRRYTASLH